MRVADLDRKDFPAVAVGGPNLILRAKQKFRVRFGGGASIANLAYSGFHFTGSTQNVAR